MEKGTVVQYNQADGKGTISSGGQPYPFSINTWKGSSAPTLNEIVLVTIEEANITEVHPVRGLVNSNDGQSTPLFQALNISNQEEIDHTAPFVIAPISQRLLAGLIDFIILVIAGTLTLGIGELVLTGVMIYMMSTPTFRGTPGQKLMGLEICDTNGQVITLGKSIVRFIVSIFSMFFLLLGYIIAIFNKKSQTLHDMAAGTLVIVRRSAKV